MDPYLTMRQRFASTFCQMMDYDLQVDRKPRCLMISSILLMDSSHSVMKRSFDNLESYRFAAFNPNSNEINMKSYNEFLQSIGGLAVFAWNFFREEVHDKAEIKNLVKIIEKMSDSLRMLKEFSKRIVSQNGQKFMIMSDENLKETVEQLLQNIESKNIIETLENKGAKDVAIKMEQYMKTIIQNIKKAEEVSNKLKQNKGDLFKPLDLQDKENEVEFLRERAASEESCIVDIERN